MKHLFTMTDTPSGRVTEFIREGTQLLLQGQPFTNRVQVFVSLGFLNKSEDLASRIGAYVHGRRWATLTRNDGHYLEVEVEDHSEDEGKATPDAS